MTTIAKTFTIPADRLKEGDLIVHNEFKARVVSAFDWREMTRLKIVRGVDLSLETLDLPVKSTVEVFYE